MLAKHKWGTPIDETNLLAVAAIDSNEYSEASEVFEALRGANYITYRGKRGIQLDNASFDKLADVLFHECGWDPLEIKLRLKHYEGWSDHEWT